MSKEHLFIKCEMWVEEGEDGQPKGIRYSYKLPDVYNDMIIELYKTFLETLCAEIAKLEGATEILGILSERVDED
jgi:hypothetical protein